MANIMSKGQLYEDHVDFVKLTFDTTPDGENDTLTLSGYGLLTNKISFNAITQDDLIALRDMLSELIDWNEGDDDEDSEEEIKTNFGYQRGYQPGYKD